MKLLLFNTETAAMLGRDKITLDTVWMASTLNNIKIWKIFWFKRFHKTSYVELCLFQIQIITYIWVGNPSLLFEFGNFLKYEKMQNVDEVSIEISQMFSLFCKSMAIFLCIGICPCSFCHPSAPPALCHLSQWKRNGWSMSHCCRPFLTWCCQILVKS